jgi:hypothetical protein
VFAVQEMRCAVAIDVRGQVVLSVDVRNRRHPFGPLNQEFCRGQEAAATAVIKMQMTKREEVDVVNGDAAGFEPLGEMRTFWQKSLERRSDRESKTRVEPACSIR